MLEPKVGDLLEVSNILWNKNLIKNIRFLGDLLEVSNVFWNTVNKKKVGANVGDLLEVSNILWNTNVKFALQGSPEIGINGR